MLYKYFGDTAYVVLNAVGYVVMILSSLLFLKSKRELLGLHSRRIVLLVSRHDGKLGKRVETAACVIESLIMIVSTGLCALLNEGFGQLVGTGANYFGLLATVPIVSFVMSSILMVDPLKQTDITMMSIPLSLFFVKLGCFCQGCCHGIPWQYGLYSQSPYHPGKQVPVQLIEVLWVVLIYIFLLKYRKKAKPGTIFPMYVILYCSTRFFSEFLRREENVFWILKTYHILCLIGLAVGILLYLIATLYGKNIQAIFEKAHKNFEKTNKLADLEAEEKERIRIAEEERLEKIRIARAKAKARRCKK